MIGVLTNPANIRIILRYIVGILVAKAIIPDWLAEMINNDPELAAAIGAIIGLSVEWAYAFAKRMGWRT